MNTPSRSTRLLRAAALVGMAAVAGLAALAAPGVLPSDHAGGPATSAATQTGAGAAPGNLWMAVERDQVFTLDVRMHGSRLVGTLSVDFLRTPKATRVRFQDRRVQGLASAGDLQLTIRPPLAGAATARGALVAGGMDLRFSPGGTPIVFEPATERARHVAVGRLLRRAARNGRAAARAAGAVEIVA